MTVQLGRPLIGSLAVAATTLLLLTSCQFTDAAPSPTSAASPSASITATPATPSPSATPQPTAEPEAVPVSRRCGELISAQAMYKFNPNFSLLSSFTPEPDSLGERAVEQRGVACRWLNQTSGAVIDVTVAQPAPSALESARLAAQSGYPVHGFGATVFFTATPGEGTAQAFTGPYWVTTTSEYFLAPEDFHDLLASVLAAVS